MGIGLIRGKSLFIDILNKYNIDFIQKKDVVIIEYNDDSVRFICSFFEVGGKIYIDKFEDKFSFVLNKCDFSKDLFNNEFVSNDLVVKILKIISNCRMIKLSIKKDNNNILLDLFSSQYSSVFDDCLVKNNNYYLVSSNNIINFEEKLNIYNEIFSSVNIKINKVVRGADFSFIENYYSKDIDKIVIINNIDTVDLIMVSSENIKFVFENRNNFFKIILPEVLKMCSFSLTSFNKEKKGSYFNKMFYMVDDKLYMLNFYDELLESSISFLYDLVKKRNHQLELSDDIIFEVSNNYDNNIKLKKGYSYGYVNILLISFVLSIVTIIVCLLKL